MQKKRRLRKEIIILLLIIVIIIQFIMLFALLMNKNKTNKNNGIKNETIIKCSNTNINIAKAACYNSQENGYLIVLKNNIAENEKQQINVQLHDVLREIPFMQLDKAQINSILNMINRTNITYEDINDAIYVADFNNRLSYEELSKRLKTIKNIEKVYNIVHE